LCPAQKIRSLIHFTGKSGMDIEGLGKKVVEQLVETGLVKDIPDIYRLEAASLETLEGWAKKSAENAIAAIAGSKTPGLAQFLTALGIRFVGEVTAQLLAKHFAGIDAIMQATENDLLAIEGIGEQGAYSIVSYFNDQANRAMIEELRALGVQIISSEFGLENLPFSGKTFLFTGGLSSMSRSEAKAKVKELGGQVASTVSKKVTHLVTGENPGSKLQKAKELGMILLSEEDFNKMLK
jgi:DNA ligase (NAD+)